MSDSWSLLMIESENDPDDELLLTHLSQNKLIPNDDTHLKTEINQDIKAAGEDEADG